MEKCQRKVNSYSITRSVYLMGLFDWRLTKEERHDNAPSVLYFERDETVPYYEEMVEVEKDTSPKLLPFWVLAAVVGVAFIVMTVYLILFLANVAGKDQFYFFFIPSMLLLLVDTLLFYLRSKQLMKYLNSEEEIVRNAENKMRLIKEKYGHQAN